ncbi:MAG: zinc ribbon domain-containing protein [Thermoplasmata archaeon]
MVSLKDVKRFLRGRIGRIVLILIAILATAGGLFVGGVLFGILAAILFGLGIPVWVGASRPRYLAVVGVAILAASPAIWAATEVPYYFIAPGAASSNQNFLQNATLSPFNAAPGSTFRWSVHLDPTAQPNATVINMTLYLSVCPGALGPSDPNCGGGGYAFQTFGPTSPVNLSGIRRPVTVWFNETISSANIWYWQMSLGYRNGTRGIQYDFLAGDSSFYNGIIGPIAGGWTMVYGTLIGTFYFAVGLYVGIPFFVALLIYGIYRVRRERKAQAASRAASGSGGGTAAGSGPSQTTAGAAPPLPSSSRSRPRPPAASEPPKEQACPNCGAVIYSGETFCWKCGTALNPGTKGSGGT